MRKVLGIILLVIGITCIGLPLLTFVGGACGSACISASAETVTNPDNSFDIRLSNPISYEYIQLNSDTTVTRRGFTFLDFDLTIVPSLNSVNYGSFDYFVISAYNLPNQSIRLNSSSNVVNFAVGEPISGSGSLSWAFTLLIFDYNPSECYIQKLSHIDGRYNSGAFWYDFITVDNTKMFTACISVSNGANNSYNIVTPFNPNTELVYYTIDFVDLYQYAQDSYQSGYDAGKTAGYNSGVQVTLGDVNPFAFVIDTADRFFELSPFGNNITFGHILSVGFGCVLLGVCIKVFLGG